MQYTAELAKQNNMKSNVEKELDYDNDDESSNSSSSSDLDDSK